MNISGRAKPVSHLKAHAQAALMEAAVLQELKNVDAVAARLDMAVSIFGSARTPRDAAMFRLAHQVAEGFARTGFAVISGGGPGIMRAVNEGARAGGGPSVGFNITLPFEPLDLAAQDISLTFDNFFTRKLAYARCSHAFVAMPGGMGTLDELFDILTLIQTGKLPDRPIVLVGSRFWRGLIGWMREQLADAALISHQEIEQIGIVDSAEEAVAFICERLGQP